MEWFKHKTASHDDPDISDCEDMFGDAGYVVFFKICEIYGQEFSHLEDGWLDVSQTFVKRKLRKSWRKVEQILNFYQEIVKKNKSKSRILYKAEYGRVKIKIPNFIDLASNWTNRKSKAPTEVPTEAPHAIDLELELDKDKEKDSAKKTPPEWKTNYEIYMSILRKAYLSIVNDHEELKKQAEFNPGVDIVKSLDKSIHNFWGTEEGWKNKKKSRAKEINMKTTLLKNLDKNKVYLPRDYKSPNEPFKPEYKVL